MATPVLSASLDKAAYAPGEVATLTVDYSDPDSRSNTITVSGTDSSGNPASITVSFNVSDPVSLSVSDDGSHVWTPVSDDGSVAVFSTTV